MMKKYLFLLSFVGISPMLYSQQLGLQTDSFDLMAKGFSLGVNMSLHQNRFFVVGGKNTLPDFLNPLHQNFSEERKYFVQAGYARFLKGEKGFFVGAECIYQAMEITAKSTSEQKENPVFRVGPLVGYEFSPLKSFKKLTLTPWISERLPVYSKEVSFGTIQEKYKTQNFNFVMGFNIGYKF